jgi:hypothetical protein
MKDVCDKVKGAARDALTTVEWRNSRACLSDILLVMIVYVLEKW